MAQVWAVLAVKNEADIIAATLAHLDSEHLAGIVVCDNGSTDGTRDLIADFASAADTRTVVDDDPDPGYYQSARMTRLAAVAGDHGAEWVLPVDADELWYSPPAPLGDHLADVRRDVNVLHVTLWNHWATALDPSGHPFTSMRYRDGKPGALGKVAVRFTPGMVIDQGNHSASFAGARLEAGWSDLAIRHFPYRSADQFVAKARTGAAAYAATDLPADMGAHWRQYGQILDLHGPDALADVFRHHFWHLSPIDDHMVEDPAPFRRWAAP